MTTSSTPIVLDPAGQDLHGEIERVRAAGPAARVELADGLQARMITDYHAIVAALRNNDVSKDAHRYWGDLAAGKVPQDSPLRPWTMDSSFFTKGGKAHRRERALVSGTFTRSRVSELEPMIHDIVKETLQEMTAHAEKPAVVDLREQFCFPVPIKTIGALIGLDDDLLPAVRAGADALFDATVSKEEFFERFGNLELAIAELVDRKMHNPGGQDLTSALLRTTYPDGSSYPRDDLRATIRVIVVAGYETTVNLIDMCVFALLTHPEHLQAVREGRITWADVIDETLRWGSPAANLPLRYAAAGIDIDGDTIEPHEAILISYAGAGRDPKIHERPEVFDPTRSDKQHLGFGHGAHYCLGANLAITETEIALAALFKAYPDMKLAEPAETIPANLGYITNGHARLLVHLAGR
ncbi:cytochrome P450 [Myceligenerans cantabricum]